MFIDEIREYCISFDNVTEGFPFHDSTLVFKTGGKIFALLRLNENPILTLKCDPEKAVEIREQYGFVEPGFHLNKKHWNTVRIGEDMPDMLLREWIQHSYSLVASKHKRIVDRR